MRPTIPTGPALVSFGVELSKDEKNGDLALTPVIAVEALSAIPYMRLKSQPIRSYLIWLRWHLPQLPKGFGSTKARSP